MKTKATGILLASVLAGNVVLSSGGWMGLPDGPRSAAADDGGTMNDSGTVTEDNELAPPTVEEARGRARVLHETIHGALQVMHRDFFREDEKLTIPSQSLEDVFRELTRTYGVKLRWLAVNTEAMNVDHEPQTEFEKQAAKKLASGKAEYEASDDKVYRHAGVIRLSSQCLKCHVPNRTSTKDRAAGLVITMPLKNENKPQHE